MKKFKTKAGHIAYKTTLSEVHSWRCLGICDECGAFIPEGGYLVPVLNSSMCEECFKNWMTRAKHYDKEDWWENNISKQYEAIIPVEILKEE